MKHLFTLILGVVSFTSFGQLNVDSLGRVDYNALHSTFLNDVWGYVDEFGNEYALVGTEDGTSVVDVTNPAAPVEVFWEPGMHSIWRDLKTWNDYAYITTEADNGLLIIDLSPLPASTALPVAYYYGVPGDTLFSAHNLFIDEFGYAYLFGSNRGNGGVQILDVATNPMAPIEVGEFDTYYVHDGYVQNDTMYLAHIDEGFFSIVDATDRTNPILLGNEFTPSTFSHNIWTSADGTHAFTTDEVSGGYIGAYNIADPTNIFEVDRIQSSPGMGIIPHNTHVLGNYLVTSYYSDGIVIHDVTHPYNMVEVGNYDTYPLQTQNYDGCWGTYPFLPSGNILASDRGEGLFILGPTYTQGAYLEGLVTDASTTNPIGNVEVQIATSVQLETTSTTGFYAAGMAAPGTYSVTYSKVGYYPQTVNVNLATGVITNQDIQLVPIPPFNVTINVVEAGTGTPILGADVQLSVPLITHTGSTNGLGQEVMTLFYQDVYEVVVGKWGYVTYCNYMFIDTSTNSITVELPLGFYDDFTFDFGWSTTSTATTGLWERGIPFGTNSNSAPSADVTNDCGAQAYVTGNAADLNSDADDVDNGETWLISPVMDLTSYTEPTVNYTRWFHCFHGPSAPDDTLFVIVNNGLSAAVIEAVGSIDPTLVDWEESSFRISDFLAITNTMQFTFKTSDISPDVNITEAAVDKFFIAEEAELAVEEHVDAFKIYPNPTNGMITIEGVQSDTDYRILNLNGTEVMQGLIENNEAQLDMTTLDEGIYFILIQDKIHKVFKTN